MSPPMTRVGSHKPVRAECCQGPRRAQLDSGHSPAQLRGSLRSQPHRAWSLGQHRRRDKKWAG